jgi:NADH:ubiquinone oxidoreductase subunit 6 (subunit J)
MTKSLLSSIIEDPVDIELIGWIMLIVGAISLIFGMMAAIAGIISKANGPVVATLLLFVTVGALAIWMGSKAMMWAKVGMIRKEDLISSLRPLTVILGIIMAFIVMASITPDLIAMEVQWLMAAGLIAALLVWLQRNRKPTARPA